MNKEYQHQDNLTGVGTKLEKFLVLTKQSRYTFFHSSEGCIGINSYKNSPDRVSNWDAGGLKLVLGQCACAGSWFGWFCIALCWADCCCERLMRSRRIELVRRLGTNSENT